MSPQATEVTQSPGLLLTAIMLNNFDAVANRMQLYGYNVTNIEEAAERADMLVQQGEFEQLLDIFSVPYIDNDTLTDDEIDTFAEITSQFNPPSGNAFKDATGSKVNWTVILGGLTGALQGASTAFQTQQNQNNQNNNKKEESGSSSNVLMYVAIGFFFLIIIGLLIFFVNRKSK